MSAACVNPAAPGGGRGALRPYLRPPGQPTATDLSPVGQLQAECVTDAGGSVLRVSVAPGPGAPVTSAVLAGATPIPGWGLHVLDMSLAGGNLVDMVGAQSRAWTAREQ
jgi:hypothetical protein